MLRARVVVALTVLLLPGILLAPVWRNAGLGAGEDDILYYYPMRALVGELRQQGAQPYFNPWTGCGRPFLADPQTAVYYPTTWLFTALPASVAYPLSLWLHYSLALFGTYRLLRADGRDRRAALFGGIAFAFSGFLLAHRAHFSMQHAAALAPWVLWRLRSYAASTQSPDAVRMSTAVMLATLQCLAGHVQIAVLTALATLVYIAAMGRGPDGAGPRLFTRLRRYFLSWALAGMIFAVQWIPTLVYAGGCTRADRTYWDFVENSWRPAAALMLALPMLFGQRTPNFFSQPYWGPSHQVEQFAYVGIATLVLALLAIRTGGWRDPRRRPWIAVGAVGLLVALGRYGPVCPLLYWLPGANLLRCPARALLLVNLALAALAAHTLHELGGEPTPDRAALRHVARRWFRSPKWSVLALFIAPLAIVLIGGALADDATRRAALAAIMPINPAVWLPLVIIVATALLLATALKRPESRGPLTALVVLVAADLGVIGWTIDVPRDRAGLAALTEPTDAAWIADVERSGRRLWTVSDRFGHRWLPGEYGDSVNKVVANTNILRHVRTLTDYGPLQPTAFARQFEFEAWGESRKPMELLRDTSWTPRFDVGWILLCEPVWPAPPGFELHTTTQQGYRLYRSTLPRMSVTLSGGRDAVDLRFVQSAPDAFRVEIQPMPSVRNLPTHGADGGVSRLVVSLAAVPGWVVAVDGQVVPVHEADGLLAVDVPTDQASDVVGVYWPAGMDTGLRVALIATAFLLLANLFGILRAAFPGRPRRTGA